MFVAIFTKLPKDLKNLKKTSIPKNRRWNLTENNPKLGLSPSKKVVFLCFNESPLKMMKNVFYFMLKTLFVLEIFQFLSWLFGYAEKQLDKKAWVNFKICDVTDGSTNNCNTYIAQYLKK